LKKKKRKKRVNKCEKRNLRRKDERKDRKSFEEPEHSWQHVKQVFLGNCTPCLPEADTWLASRRFPFYCLAIVGVKTGRWNSSGTCF
jgi:hypothetical protein